MIQSVFPLSFRLRHDLVIRFRRTVSRTLSCFRNVHGVATNSQALITWNRTLLSVHLGKNNSVHTTLPVWFGSGRELVKVPVLILFLIKTGSVTQFFLGTDSIVSILPQNRTASSKPVRNRFSDLANFYIEYYSYKSQIRREC